MISKVSTHVSTWNELPWKFEAGTPDIAGAVGLGAAVDYLNNIGMDKVRQHDIELVDYAMEKLSKIPEVTVYGPPSSVIARSETTKQSKKRSPRSARDDKTSSYRSGSG